MTLDSEVILEEIAKILDSTSSYNHMAYNSILVIRHMNDYMMMWYVNIKDGQIELIGPSRSSQNPPDVGSRIKNWELADPNFDPQDIVKAIETW